jgi:hypothetical protein
MTDSMTAGGVKWLENAFESFLKVISHQVSNGRRPGAGELAQVPCAPGNS